MVPPPDSMGDEFPDFESMSLEEQMAWLESLAKRQGAKEEEFTTTADLDIPVPEDAVVDEPGYVPYSISGKPAEEQPASEPEPEPEQELEPESVILEDVAAEVALEPADEMPESPVLEAVGEVDTGVAEDAGDPMQWLDSLAVQPGEEFQDYADEVDTGFEAVELEPGPIEGLDLAPPLDEVVEPEAEPAIADEDDPLAGVDPMLWLESLAARQGASQDQLTTSANLESTRG